MTEVECLWGGTFIYFNLLTDLKLREECSRTLGWNPAGAASGRQQSKRTQSGSSSRSGRDREQQLKRTQVASMQQQLKQAQSGSAAGSGRKRGAAVEAMQSGSGAEADSKWTQAASSS